MDTLEYILNKYELDINDDWDRVCLKMGRFKDFPRLLNELGFNLGAEIGVYRAFYSKKLMHYIDNLYLIGVDSWAVYDKYKDYSGNDIVDAERESREVYSVWGNKAEIRKGWSRDIVNTVEDESLDFVYIDGNHALEYVIEDIKLWSKKVKKGGIVSGHDYDDYTNNKRWDHMHVEIAVEAWRKAYKIKPLFVMENNRNKSWFYVK